MIVELTEHLLLVRKKFGFLFLGLVFKNDNKGLYFIWEVVGD